MNGKRKGEYVGMLGALLVHVAIIALLILVSFTVPKNQDEGGVPVMMGDVDIAQGNYDLATMVDVDVLPPEEVPEVKPQETTEQEMITQTDEETVAIKPKTEPKKEKTKEVKKPEKTAAEKAAEAKKRRKENGKLLRKPPQNGCRELSAKGLRWKEARELLITERAWKAVKTEILQPVLKQERVVMERLTLVGVL